ncbi:hypothetical protein C6503_17605 [Candidatus Poribacteria bacterium]|nr:MAG: hypothetical protein C6503_17605 [Candidatus Poribacteria bacterium]
MASYPNRDALRKAHDIYLNAMKSFILECLKKSGGTAEGKAIEVEDTMEIADIPYLVNKYWERSFEQYFTRIDRYYEIRGVTWVIKEGRNRASHPPWDLDPEFTQTHLFLIANLLEKIDRPDAKRRVENIQDGLFSDNIARQTEEVEQAAYKKRLETMSTQLAIAVAGKTTAEEHLSDISNQLEEAERENAAYKKRIETISDQLEEANAEKTKYGKALKAASHQLATLKRVNAQLEERLEVTSTRLEDVEAELTACKKDLARTLSQLEGTKAGQTEYHSLEERLALLKGNGKTTTPRRGYPSSEERLARTLTESEKEETEEERVEIAKRVAELRLNPDASRKMSWKNIREEVLLTNDEFHENIRISDYYKEVMLERLGNLIDEGWVYNGCLNILCGFDVPEEFVERME